MQCLPITFLSSYYRDESFAPINAEKSSFHLAYLEQATCAEVVAMAKEMKKNPELYDLQTQEALYQRVSTLNNQFSAFDFDFIIEILKLMCFFMEKINELIKNRS